MLFFILFLNILNNLLFLLLSFIYFHNYFILASEVSRVEYYLKNGHYVGCRQLSMFWNKIDVSTCSKAAVK